MTPIQFAAALEASIRQEFESMIERAPQELGPLFIKLSKVQTEFELLLDRAQGINPELPQYPDVDQQELIGSDEEWRILTRDFADAPNKSIICLILLLAAVEFLDKSEQFYRQAAVNSAHPTTKFFISSMAEVKAILRRRVDGVLRVMYNQAWGELGFAPFTKD